MSSTHDRSTTDRTGREVAAAVADSGHVGDGRAIPQGDAPRASSINLAAHHINLFYLFRRHDEGDGPVEDWSIRLRDLVSDAAPVWIPSDVVPAVQGRYGEERVWRRIEPAGGLRSGSQRGGEHEPKASSMPGKSWSSGDLCRPIEDLFGGRRSDLLGWWTLGERAMALIEDAGLYEQSVAPDRRTAKDLTLLFDRKRARERIDAQLGASASYHLFLKIDGVELLQFRTRIGLVKVEARVERPDRMPLTPAELIETVASLSRFNRLQWRLRSRDPISPGAPLDGPKFSLGSLVRTLIGQAFGREQEGARVFTYTIARSTNSPAQATAERFAMQLARQYTEDHAAVATSSTIFMVQEFENVRHCCAVEGAATLISDDAHTAIGTVPEFISQIYETTIRRNYLPIVLLNLHERTELLDLSTESAFWPDTRCFHQDTLQRLEAIRDRSLKLRICYSFAEVSEISIHNDFNRAIRKAFALDRMLSELNQKVIEVDGFLRQMDFQQSQARFRWPGIFGAAALAGLSAFTILKELVFVPTQDAVVAGWAGVVGSLLAFGAAFVIGWRR